ncbi:uncharacterized protein LOC119093909 [Pollicipes pollicipes]|uniref:uncharacterized protein LOC119093909 n=1 Tax=Pollicipes pollicipes TaxID=41117 RepID=UPI0018853E29|nr:uncharacterized protein LOC119093909 [Pollicipes pollicipes]
MDTNAYEIRLPEINVQGIYPRAALFEHNCVPNTHRTFDADLTLVVRAAVDIEKGEHLSSIYTDNLWGTWERREHLLNSKHFLCECARCADPSELDTHLSSLKCTQCQDGFIQPSDPLDSDSYFTCDTCGAHVSAVPVRATLEELQAEVDRVEEDPSIAACETLVWACSKILHPNHYLILDLTYPLMHLYNSSEPLSREQLDRKEQLCKQFLRIADVLTPGISRLRGIVLFELQQSTDAKGTYIVQLQGRQDKRGAHQQVQGGSGEPGGGSVGAAVGAARAAGGPTGS